jgi:SRSO17 transposase
MFWRHRAGWFFNKLLAKHRWIIERDYQELKQERCGPRRAFT